MKLKDKPTLGNKITYQDEVMVDLIGGITNAITEKIGWLRTYDKDTGKIASEEALIPPSYHGVLSVVNSGGMQYALSETEETYDLVPDTIANIPEGIKEDLLNTYKRQDLK